MALAFKAIAISDITRFEGAGSNGLISADVTIDLEDGDTGVEPRIVVRVDLPGAESLSFAEIEARSLVVALEVLTHASHLEAVALEASFRAKFTSESPAG